MNRLFEIFWVALKLGVTSFGGPTAHLGYFREEYVVKKQWLSDKVYQDLVALCQFLPGPASSQVGMAIGMLRGGILGGVLAFLGFTLPSVLMLIAAVYLFDAFDMSLSWLQGLKLVAVAVVLHALIGMGKSSLKSWQTIAIAAFALAVSLLLPTSLTQIAVIIVSGIIGYLIFKTDEKAVHHFDLNISRKTGVFALSMLLLILFVLPLLNIFIQNHWLSMFDKFYRSGLLVFGGGHVVLPLLESEFVPGMVNPEQFIAGYGLAQAVPGPLFTFAAFLGADMDGWIGGLFAMVAIFLPAFLLVLGCLPFWNTLSRNKAMRRALTGINAGVIGILAAAWIHPIITHSIFSIWDVLFAALFFVMLHYFRWAPWIIVLCGIIVGLIFY